MKTILVFASVVAVAVALPFGFPRQATGNAQGSVNQGGRIGPYGSQRLTETSSLAQGNSIGGAPSFNNAHASSGKGIGGVDFAKTGASSIQPGGFGISGFPSVGGGFSGGGGFSRFGAGGFGFPGFGGTASGAAEGSVSESESTGPHGYTKIVNTVSKAGGTSINGAPSFSSAHATNQRGPGGTSVSQTGASSVQPGFRSGQFGGGFGSFGGHSGFRQRFH